MYLLRTTKRPALGSACLRELSVTFVEAVVAVPVVDAVVSVVNVLGVVVAVVAFVHHEVVGSCDCHCLWCNSAPRTEDCVVRRLVVLVIIGMDVLEVLELLPAVRPCRPESSIGAILGGVATIEDFREVALVDVALIPDVVETM